MSAGKDSRHHPQEEQQPHYGTFQGVANYPQPPAIGFPQPVPPPGATVPLAQSPPQYYAHGYQGVPVANGLPIRERRLPCCGIGLGWFFFIIGFFLAAIPWYLGAFILLCARIDHREKPGYITCTIATLNALAVCFAVCQAILATFAVIFGATKNDW